MIMDEDRRKKISLKNIWNAHKRSVSVTNLAHHDDTLADLKTLL